MTRDPLKNPYYDDVVLTSTTEFLIIDVIEDAKNGWGVWLAIRYTDSGEVLLMNLSIARWINYWVGYQGQVDVFPAH